MHMPLMRSTIHLAMYGHCLHVSLYIHNKQDLCVDMQMNITYYDWCDVRLSWKQVTRVQQTWLARNVDYDDKMWKYNLFYGS